MNKYVIPICLAALLISFAAHAAEKCTLPQIASLSLKPLADGRYTIPVAIAGAEHDFILELNNPFSAISGALADAQGYDSRKMRRGFIAHVNGEEITRQVTVGELAIGTSRGKDFVMLRADKALNGGASGVAGLDLFKNFDLELDLKHGKLNLFSQDHCEGNVVYWSPDYAVVPFEADDSGHVSFAMRLDDRPVTVDFDLREGPSLMGSKTLRRLFDLTTSAPGMTAETHAWGTTWSYPFKTLSIEGLSIANPRIAIVAQEGHECRPETRWINGREQACFGDADLNLHSSVLKALHLYFAFKEKKLYVTAADAHL